MCWICTDKKYYHCRYKIWIWFRWKRRRGSGRWNAYTGQLQILAIRRLQTGTGTAFLWQTVRSWLAESKSGKRFPSAGRSHWQNCWKICRSLRITLRREILIFYDQSCHIKYFINIYTLLANLSSIKCIDILEMHLMR